VRHGARVFLPDSARLGDANAIPTGIFARIDSGSNFRRRDEHFEKLACQAVATIGRLGVYEAKQNVGCSFEQGRLLSAVSG
jgi:hypothetical protein